MTGQFRMFYDPAVHDGMSPEEAAADITEKVIERRGIGKDRTGELWMLRTYTLKEVREARGMAEEC